MLIGFLIVLTSGYLVTANTPEQDLNIQLFLEIGDEAEDFNDADKKIAKGQFVTYRIDIKNESSSSYYTDALVLMDIPDFMTYVPDSTFQIEGGGQTLIPDLVAVDPVSALESGYSIGPLGSGEIASFLVSYQVRTDITSDTEVTLAWANVATKYNSIPIQSNIIESEINGEPSSFLRIEVTSFPEAGQQVFSNGTISYSYIIKNNGGKKAEELILTTFIPNGTDCISGCGAINIGTLEPNGVYSHSMDVRIKSSLTGLSEIRNEPFTLVGKDITEIKGGPIIHPLTIQPAVDPGEFWIDVTQGPGIILNSKNGVTARGDQFDITDTQYRINHKGLQEFVYPNASSPSGHHSFGNGSCRVAHAYPEGAYFYAYNDFVERNCRNYGIFDSVGCLPQLSSNPLQFELTIDLPSTAPELVDPANINSNRVTHMYEYPGGPWSNPVNRYMTKTTEPHKIDVTGLMLSRAIRNGSGGSIKASIRTVGLVQSRWEYRTIQYRQCRYSCGRSVCKVNLPIKRWVRQGGPESGVRNLTDDATANISVLTSTAWLKTQGGHVGTNIYTDATRSSNPQNIVNLSYQNIAGVQSGNSQAFTPSNQYTPTDDQVAEFSDGVNSDYMIFTKNGNSAGYDSEQGNEWVQTNSEFSSKNTPNFLQKGESYDRDELPREYDRDLLDREIFGEVKENGLPPVITSNIDVGNQVIWKNSGDINLGRRGFDDTLILKGGQARIYTPGDVYINANLKYEDKTVSSYEQITSVRIDARNIYIAPEVTDIEVMLLARNEFHSGSGNQQLRILGDVIADKSFWERTPLLEENPTEFNRPSEHIIEDYRKYVSPPPGDTQLPEERSVWRQVNPSTGEVMDAY